MADATGRPQRMRYSFEARCRAVALMRAGVSPGAAAATVGASRATGFRLAGAVPGRGLAGAARASVHAEAAAPPPQRGGRSHDPGRPRAQWDRPAHARCAARSARLDHRQGAAAGWGVRDAHDSRGRRSSATSAPGRAICCTWTPRSWAASGTSASASTAMASSAARGPAGSTCTSPSTTIRGWPTPRCGPATARTDALAFLERALAWYHAQGFRVREVMTDNGPAYRSRAWRGPPARRVGSATAGRGPTRRAPMARPSALSRSSCGAGPTAWPTHRAPTVPGRSPAGCGGITVAVPMARLAVVRRSAVSHTSVVSTARCGSTRAAEDGGPAHHER